ncbi:MAG: tryptophan-rich sensory protein [Bacilli bacterium]|nr:tryptophan-rich sensory protein [Bacilli bacterium]
MKKLKSLFIIFGPLIGGILVGIISQSKNYQYFIKPILSPPGFIFPIVWSILYLLMGISLYIIKKEKQSIKITFLLQLLTNYLWPILFFNFKLYTISAVWLILLIALTIKMIIEFYNIKKIAGLLQFPYFLWLLFALYLNIGVAILN